MKRESKKYFILPFLLFSAVGLLVFSNRVRENIVQTFSLAVGTVIPGLFPFLVLSDFVCNTFRLSPKKHKTCFSFAGLPAVVFGLTGGYLTGCKTVLSLYENGQITKTQARHLCCFCFSPGLAFAIGTVGNGMFGNAAIGLLLFACCTLAALFSGLFHKKEKSRPTTSAKTNHNLPMSHIFTLSVGKSAQACLQMTAWMAVFASLQAVLFSVLPENIHTHLSLFSEVTTGVVQCVQSENLPLCAAVLGFGGFCIFLQLLPDLQKIGLSAVRFLRFRLLQAVLSFGFCKLFLFLFPGIGIAKSTMMVKTYSVNPTASLFFLFACFIFILDLAPQKKMCYYIKEYTENRKT